MTKNLYILAGALVFILSGITLNSNSAFAAETAVSECTSDLLGLRVQLGSSDTAKCKTTVKRNGKNVKIQITAKKKKVKVFGEANESEVADLEMQAETECHEGCENGVRRGTPLKSTFLAADAQKIKDFLTQNSDTAVDELAGGEQASEEKEPETKAESCLVDAKGAQLSKSAQLQCRFESFYALKAEEREAYYDQYLKGNVEQGLQSSDKNVRDQAHDTLVKYSGLMNDNQYLKKSVLELNEMYNAHELGNSIIAKLKANPNDPHRYSYFGQWNAVRANMQARAQKLNAESANVLTPDQLQNLNQDYANYQKSLEDLQSKFPVQIPNSNGNAGTPGRNQHGSDAGNPRAGVNTPPPLTGGSKNKQNPRGGPTVRPQVPGRPGSSGTVTTQPGGYGNGLPLPRIGGNPG